MALRVGATASHAIEDASFDATWQLRLLLGISIVVINLHKLGI